MKKVFFSVCAVALFAFALTSNSFDNSAFRADTVASLSVATVDGEMDFDGRNFASISTNGQTASISGTESISVTSEGGTASGTITSYFYNNGGSTTGVNPTFTSSSTTSSTSSTSSTSTLTSSSTTTTTGGFNICDFVTSAYLKAKLGCD
jgi:hypothetical protein